MQCLAHFDVFGDNSRINIVHDIGRSNGDSVGSIRLSLIHIYFFSRNKVWKEYERIQSDIFDHLLAMVPKFDLKVYQYSD